MGLDPKVVLRRCASSAATEARGVIGCTEPDDPTSLERLASLSFIIFTQLLTADTDVLAVSSDHIT